MRVAVVDIGTNSTRLLVAERDDGRVTGELARRSTVTRLGDGVDAGGRLGEAGIARVFSTLDLYRLVIEELGAERRVADPSDPLTEITDDKLKEEEHAVREQHGDIGTPPPPDNPAGGGS